MSAPLVVYVTPEAGERVAFSTAETARLLGVSEWAVKQAIGQGRLVAVNVNERLVRIPAWSIDAFLTRPAELERGNAA